ncbi:hypothetical protein KM043_008915 [Ampulex compressa]|nr:hypothetical protein KM043_008915 [Ampulex compressa]
MPSRLLLPRPARPSSPISRLLGGNRIAVGCRIYLSLGTLQAKDFARGAYDPGEGSKRVETKRSVPGFRSKEHRSLLATATRLHRDGTQRRSAARRSSGRFPARVRGRGGPRDNGGGCAPRWELSRSLGCVEQAESRERAAVTSIASVEPAGI